jgi:hypothetical protein
MFNVIQQYVEFRDSVTDSASVENLFSYAPTLLAQPSVWTNAPLFRPSASDHFWRGLMR